MKLEESGLSRREGADIDDPVDDDSHPREGRLVSDRRAGGMFRESTLWEGTAEDVVKKVLVGVDGSKESRIAADRAAELARALDAELTVACVVPAPSPGPFESRETVRRRERRPA